MFTKIPFRVNYPLKIFHPTKIINFEEKEEREKLFSRNIYCLFDPERQSILEEKHKLFLDLGKEILKYMDRYHKDLQILNLSLFGSSLVLENPGDYDFLAITQGNIFLLEEPLLRLKDNFIQTGVSIKGVENYILGFKKKDNTIESGRLEQIIDRTSISLFRRHIPLFGREFINNEGKFLNNAYAQISDLLNNAYDLFYLERGKDAIPEEKRARKLLTRCYEASSYLKAVDSDEKIQRMRERIYSALESGPKINESKGIFEEFGRLYEEKVTKKIL